MSPGAAEALPFVVHSQCTFLRPLSYPEVVIAAMGVSRLGNSSVEYDCAVFASSAGAQESPAAVGKFVHVWTHDNQAVEIPADVRAAYAEVLLPPTTS